MELLDQILSLFADVLLQHAAVLWGGALQAGKGAQGAVGQLSAGSPHAGLVGAEGQTLAVIDEPERVQVWSAGKVLPLLDESLPNCLQAAQHDHGTHANLDLEDVSVTLAHGRESQVRVLAHLQHISDERKRPGSRQRLQPLRDLSFGPPDDQVDQTQGGQGHQTF